MYIYIYKFHMNFFPLSFTSYYEIIQYQFELFRKQWTYKKNNGIPNPKLHNQNIRKWWRNEHYREQQQKCSEVIKLRLMGTIDPLKDYGLISRHLIK